MSQILCLGCRAWFDGKHSACPDCDWERPKHNSWLASAKLNGHLNGMAASAAAEKVYADAHGL